MNKARRKALNKIQDRLSDFRNKAEVMEALYNQIIELRDEIEEHREAEQESFDNMPEGAQSGERGAAMEEAISQMDNAYNQLDSIASQLDPGGLSDMIDEAFNALEEAKGPTE